MQGLRWCPLSGLKQHPAYGPPLPFMTQHGHAGTFHMTMEGLGRIERTDGDVISIRISERKLHSSSAGIHMWLFFQPTDERTRPWQSYVKVVDAEEQEEAVARLGVVGTCQ